MSIFKDFNNLYKNDPALIETQLINISNSIENEDDALFGGMLYDPKSAVVKGRKLFYSERSVNEKVGHSGIRTHLEAVIYYVLDSNGKLINDPVELKEAFEDLSSLIEQRVGR